mmetsp:Transcript_2246/g.8933  ORF Transcript_2246/g.8933 Transcript_2246/m.8933 type:complete len:233 (+) Transcript_2246:1327-2025(+)
MCERQRPEAAGVRALRRWHQRAPGVPHEWHKRMAQAFFLRRRRCAPFHAGCARHRVRTRRRDRCAAAPQRTASAVRYRAAPHRRGGCSCCRRSDGARARGDDTCSASGGLCGACTAPGVALRGRQRFPGAHDARSTARRGGRDARSGFHRCARRAGRGWPSAARVRGHGRCAHGTRSGGIDALHGQGCNGRVHHAGGLGGSGVHRAQGYAGARRPRWTERGGRGGMVERSAR